MESTIPPWELLGRLGDEDVVVVDCRSAEEAHRMPVQVPGALRMTVEDIQQSPHALPDDELVVLCDADGGLVSRRAWRLLSLAGRSAVVLRGGLRGWIQAGNPTERVPRRARRPAGVPGEDEQAEALDELAVASPVLH